MDQGGFGDDLAGNNFHAAGLVVWDKSHPDYRLVADWIAAARLGPGISIGNFGSKPAAMALSNDERFLYIGNQGTQDISIVDLRKSEEITGIYTQNIITDLAIYHDPRGNRDFLIALSMGAEVYPVLWTV